MSFKNADGRQYVLAAVVKVDHEDMVAGVVPFAALPAGARVVGGEIDVITAFDSTTNALSIGDADSATAYASAVDLKTVASTALSVPDKFVTDANKDLIATVAQTGTAPTTGLAYVTIQYVVAGKANEVQG